MTRVVAVIMLILGGLGLLVSCEMDTSVPTGHGRVINLPLAAQQQNMSIISAVLFIGGIILFATSKSPTRNLSGADFRSCEPSHEEESKG